MSARVRSPLKEVQPLASVPSPAKTAEGSENGSDAVDAERHASLVAQVFAEGPILSSFLPFCDIETLISLTNYSPDLREAARTHLGHRRSEVREEHLLWAARHGCAFALDFLYEFYISGRLLSQHEPGEILCAAVESGSPAAAVTALRRAESFSVGFREEIADEMSEALILSAVKCGSTAVLKLVVAELGVHLLAGFNRRWTPLKLSTNPSKDDTAPIERYMEGMSGSCRQKFFKEIRGGRAPLLVHAARNRRRPLVQALLDHGCPHGLRDASGWTALHWSCFNDDAALAAVLLSHGADPNMKVADNGKTPLHFAAAERSLECIDALLEGGADPRAAWVPGQTATPSRRRASTVRSLMGSVNEQAQATAFGAQELPWLAHLGLRPIDLAAVAGHAEAVRRLGQAMLADGNGTVFPNGRWDSLKYSVLKGRGDVLDALLDVGASVDATDADGAGPLHWAVSAGDISMVTALLEAGADTALTDSEGRMAGDLVKDAFEGDDVHETVWELLAKAGKEG